MKNRARPPSDSTMKKYRLAFCLLLVACSSSTTVVYQVVNDAGPGDAGATVDGSVFAEAKDGSQEQDTGAADAGDPDATDATFDGAWTDASFDAWTKDTSFDSSDGF